MTAGESRSLGSPCFSPASYEHEAAPSGHIRLRGAAYPRTRIFDFIGKFMLRFAKKHFWKWYYRMRRRAVTATPQRVMRLGGKKHRPVPPDVITLKTSSSSSTFFAARNA